MAESATAAPPVEDAEDAAPKPGEAAAPPPLELIASLPATLDAGQVKVTWKVAGKAGDDGDFEYFAIVRVPDIDLQSTVSAQKPLAVTLKPDLHVIATQVNAIGGAPLAGTKVQAVDPETGLPEGDPVETDEQGKVLLTVADNKPHDIKIIDEDDHEPASPEQLDPEQPGAEDAARLYVRVFEGGGATRPGVAFKVAGPDGFSDEGTTDADGDIELMGVAPGAYEVTIGDQKFKVHSIFQSDLQEDPSPYRLVTGLRQGAAQA